MRVKKGQLRRWSTPGHNFGTHEAVFVTLSSRVARDRGPRPDLGWGGRHRGEILWTILEAGYLVEDVPQIEIHEHSEVISDTG